MTKKDYELIAKWLKDYSYVSEVTPEDGNKYKEARFYRGAILALAIRLQKDNPRFDMVKFVQASGHDPETLGV